VSAVRELFEEVGILMAVDSSGTPIGRRLAGELFRRQRRSVEKPSFSALLETEELYCDLSRLFYVSHWQTPAETALRFDTRFFAAALPEGQNPLESSAEVTHGVWLTPELAMQRYARGELPMIFPTYASLRTLADFEDVEAVIKEFGRHPRGYSPSSVAKAP
jgi:8-oxo-dGTP pyrophosphatase MutT (NUDIX family)